MAGTLIHVSDFSWVVPDELAAMMRPGRVRALSDDLTMLREQRIELLVSLTMVPTDEVAARAHGIEVVHIPIGDFTPPTIEQIEAFVTLVNGARAQGRATAVHCAAGLGRTGTMLAAYLVSRGSTGADAIARVRALRPGSIETDDQRDAILAYARRLETSGGVTAAP